MSILITKLITKKVLSFEKPVSNLAKIDFIDFFNCFA
jgi:hypothetical protein